VRDNRAHSWAEAYLGELGWMRVDATPPAKTLFRTGRLRQLLDSIDFFWGRWVVGYDLGRQLDLARRLGRQLGVAEGDDGPHHRWKPTLPGKGIAFALGLAALLALGWRLTRRGPRAERGRPPVRRDVAPVTRLYDKALARLARRGLPRHPAETPREFAARVAREQVVGAQELTRLTELYTAARFGRQPVADSDLEDIARRLGDLGTRAGSPPAAPGAAA